jgi:hypothetical protein
MQTGHYVNYPFFLSNFNETRFSFRQIAEKSSKLKFRENPSSGSRVVPFGLMDGPKDKYDEASSFPNGPKNCSHLLQHV